MFLTLSSAENISEGEAGAYGFQQERLITYRDIHRSVSKAFASSISASHIFGLLIANSR